MFLRGFGTFIVFIKRNVYCTFNDFDSLVLKVFLDIVILTSSPVDKSRSTFRLFNLIIQNFNLGRTNILIKDLTVIFIKTIFVITYNSKLKLLTLTWGRWDLNPRSPAPQAGILDQAFMPKAIRLMTSRLRPLLVQELEIIL